MGLFIQYIYTKIYSANKNELIEYDVLGGAFRSVRQHGLTKNLWAFSKIWLSRILKLALQKTGPPSMNTSTLRQ